MDADGDPYSFEYLTVRNWRFDAARKAGLSGVEAALFAESDRDLAELRKLIEKGCPVEQLRAIVL